MVEPSRNIISKKCLSQTFPTCELRMLLKQILDIFAQLLLLETLYFKRQRNYLRWLLYRLKQLQLYKLQLTVVQLLKFSTLYSINGVAWDCLKTSAAHNCHF